MGNVLLQNLKNNSGQTMGSLLSQIKAMGPSSKLYNKMYNENPEFKKFADSMNGKTPEQAFSENGLDFNKFKNLKW